MSKKYNSNNKKANRSSDPQIKSSKKSTGKSTKKLPAKTSVTKPSSLESVAESSVKTTTKRAPSAKQPAITSPKDPSSSTITPQLSSINTVKVKMDKTTKPHLKTLNIISRILVGIAIVSFLLLIINILRLNILPTKYVLIIIGGMIILTIINLFCAFFKKKPLIFRPVSIVLSILFSAISIFAFLKINDTINFFSNFGSDKITNTYNIIVAKDSKFNENSDLAEKTIYVYRDLAIDQNLIIDAINNNYKANTEFVDNILTLATDLMNNTEKIGAINAGTYEAFLSDNDFYKDSFKIIKSFDIITDAEQSNEVDITKDPFIVFLSGIDTRTGTLPSRSLSDVNIVATINPKEHKILLTAIPRDYYVHLAGTPEDSLNDKLTHAGSHGGIALSKATVEELLGIEINYYARVNFNFVKNIVDAIGGITINSDVDYSFRCWTDKGCTFYPGDNPVDGRCALAFARERKSYSAGDRHRGENQEQVISLILDKISKSSTLLSNYSGILAALDGTFETNIEMNDITAFFKNQLEDMKPWKATNLNLNGTGAMDITYSYPSQPLSVMYPNESTIEAAKAKIYEYLGQEYQPAQSEATTETAEE